jgi:hypothetical protein
VNAFSQDWGSDGVSFCFPPAHLVARTLQHARACQACITLVVLGWRSAPWWPLLCGSVASGHSFAPFVRRQLFFPSARDVLVPGLASADQFFVKGVPLSDVYVLDVDFSCRRAFFHRMRTFSCLFCSIFAELFLLGNWSLEVCGLSTANTQLAALLSQLKTSLPLSRAPGT